MTKEKSFNIFGKEELNNLHQVVESQSAWRGFSGENFVTQFEDEFAKHVGIYYGK